MNLFIGYINIWKNYLDRYVGNGNKTASVKFSLIFSVFPEIMLSCRQKLLVR